MTASVPALLDKIARHRPRFVCFVGMVIWETIQSNLVKLLPKGIVRRTGKGEGREKNQMGLQAYKLVCGNTKGGY